MIPMKAHEIEKKVMTCMDKSFIIKTEILHFKLYFIVTLNAVSADISLGFTAFVFLSVL